ESRTAHDVSMNMPIEHEAIRHVRVVDRWREAQPDGDAAVPAPIRWRRRPTDVVVALVANAPVDPRRRIRSARNPDPAICIAEDPAAVVKRHPSPREVTGPDVVAAVVLPAAAGLV